MHKILQKCKADFSKEEEINEEDENEEFWREFELKKDIITKEEMQAWQQVDSNECIITKKEQQFFKKNTPHAYDKSRKRRQSIQSTKSSRPNKYLCFKTPQRRNI